MVNESEVIELIDKLRLSIEAGRHEEARSDAVRLEELIRGELEPGGHELAEMLDLLAWGYNAMSDSAEAVRLFREELEIRDALDPDATDVLDQVAQLGVLYAESGNAREALPFLRRSLKMSRRDENIDAATLRGHIRYVAQLETQLANYDEAELLYRELLATAQDDEPGLRNDLANVLVQSGALDAAEELLQPIVRRMADDASTATALSILGDLYYHRGETARARPLIEESLRIGARCLAADDPQLGVCLSNAGGMRLLAGEFAAAEQLLLRAEQVTSKAAAHSAELVLIRTNLANLYLQTGRFSEAEAHAKLAVAGSIALVGEDHFQTALAWNGLAAVYQATGCLEEALPLMEAVLRVWRTRGSPIEIVTATHNLGGLHLLRGEYDQALLLLKDALEQGTAALGGNHSLIATTLDTLAQLHYMRGEGELGLTAAQQALEIRRQTQGERHPEFAASLSNVAKLLIDLARESEAQPLLLQATALERETLGPDHLRYGIDLGNLALSYFGTDQPEKAEEIYHEALRIIRNSAGAQHFEVATVLGNLAAILYQRGDIARAIDLSRQALAIDAEALGKQHPKLATDLHNLSSLLVERGSYLEAQPLAVRALEIARRALPPESIKVSLASAKQADIQHQLGNYRVAESLMLEELEREERQFGGKHPYIAQLLTALADVYREAGRLPDAAYRAQRAVEILTGAGETSSARFAAALSMQALVQQAQGHYAAAHDNLLRCRDIQARVSGDTSREYAETLMNLGTLYTETGRYSEAVRFHSDALALVRRIVGPEHPQSAAALDNLAMVQAARGEFAEAERLLLESREIKRETLGDKGPDFALTLHNLSVVHGETGAHTSARRLLEQALEIERAALDGPHPLTALTLGSLAFQHLQQREIVEAAALLRESLEMRRLLLGDEHPEVARSFDMLGMIHLYLDELDEAERRCRHAFDLLRAAFPDPHPEVARALNNLAAIQQRRGNFSAAETLEREALEMWRLTRGEEHPGLFTPLSNLSSLLAAQGRYDEALEMMLRLEALNDLVIVRTLPGSSEYRCLAWLDSMRMSMEGFLSLLLRHLLDAPRAVRLACDLVLRRKAVVFEILARQRATVRRQARNIAPILKELKEQQRLLTEESLVAPGLDGEKQHRMKIAALEVAVEELEAEVARSIPAAGVEQRLRRTGRAAIAATLDAGAALVEIVRFDVVNFTAVASQPLSDEARYLAFIIPARRPDDVHTVDLGDADEIDRKLETFRTWIETGIPCDDPAIDGTALREQVFDPIARELPDCGRFVIAPDSALHRLPFEALPTAGGYVLDTYRISYVVAGRDVVESARRPRHRGTTDPLVAAGPDFDLGKPPKDPSDLMPLKGAAREGVEVAAALGVKPLLGADVLKETIQLCRSPRIFHLATHGFFLPDPRKAKPASAATMAGPRDVPGLALFCIPPNDPLLRSGLALAGANRVRKGLPVPETVGNGFLFAEDVLSLELDGTELVVLSACETGLGDIHTNEGVYGLRRTFLLAGARTLVTSLWRVPDAATRRLMVEMYRRILGGVARSEALRTAQQFIRNRPSTRHPFYWGAFICIGDAGVLPKG